MTSKEEPEETEQRWLEMDTNNRIYIKANRNGESRRIVHLTYCSKLMDAIRIRDILNQIIPTYFGDVGLEAVSDTMFSWKYGAKLSDLIYKPFHTFVDKRVPKCPCSNQSLIDYIDKQHGHVLTTDFRIVRNKSLRNLLKKGLNHIPHRRMDINECLNAALEGLHTFLIVNRMALDIKDLDHKAMQLIETAFRERVLVLLKEYLGHSRGKIKHYILEEDEDAINNLEWITKNLFVAGVDKATNNPSFMCPFLAKSLAMTRLNSKDFISSHIPVNEIQMEMSISISNFIPKDHNQEDIPRLPYLLCIFKAHKNSFRWITNAHGSMFSELANLVSNGLKNIIDIWPQITRDLCKNVKIFCPKGFSPNWLVDSIYQVSLNLPKKIHSVYVADITKCFESIPLEGDDGLCSIMEKVITTAFNFQRKVNKKTKMFYKQSRSTCGTFITKWDTKSKQPECWTEITCEEFCKMNVWLLKNCWLCNNEMAWRQCSGIPMGFSCSPSWCNIYLAWYEVHFILKLAKTGRYKDIERFKSSFRYMDDLLLINCGNPCEFFDKTSKICLYNMECLEIKEETSNFIGNTLQERIGLTANFLNMKINILDASLGLFKTSKYDKRDALPFVAKKYVLADSCRPYFQASKVICSQVMPCLYTHSNAKDAAADMGRIMDGFIENGFDHRTILRNVTMVLEQEFPGLRFPAKNLIKSLKDR